MSGEPSPARSGWDHSLGSVTVRGSASVTIVIIILAVLVMNIVLFHAYAFFQYDRVSRMILANVTVFFAVLIFTALQLARRREMKTLYRELDRLNLRSEDGQREIQILHTLNDISESFVHETNISVIFEQTLLSIRGILAVDIAVLFLVEPETGEVKHRIYKGVENLEIDKPVLNRVLCKGASVLINGLSPAHSQFNNFTGLYEQGFQSVMIAPIRIKERIMGLLGVFTRSQSDFTGADLRILTTFSTHVSIIMENGRLLEETQQLAMTDELTQLYNFRYFRQRLREEFSRAERYFHPLSVVMLDIDYFKNYNDSQGHPMGDVVLRDVASLLRDNIRETDFAARYGGEEFVIILLEMDKDAAAKLAEKLRECIENRHSQYQEQQPNKNLTMRHGVAA